MHNAMLRDRPLTVAARIIEKLTMSLDINIVKSELNNLSIPAQLYFFPSINSTNTFLKEKQSDYPLEICIADEQTHGRGQGNNIWHSPPAANIYCSTKWRLPLNPNMLSGLSLAVGLAIVNTIQKVIQSVKRGISGTPRDPSLYAWEDVLCDLHLKWPNDVLWQHKKLAGILIEIIPALNGHVTIVIGIGLNVNVNFANDIWCSLADITKTSWNRTRLLIELIKQLQQILQAFCVHGFSYFKDIWNKFDYLKDKKITLTTPKEILYGVGQGVNDAGYLLLKNAMGEIKAFNYGKVALFPF